jgi:hypothetical protein
MQLQNLDATKNTPDPNDNLASLASHRSHSNFPPRRRFQLDIGFGRSARKSFVY